MFLKANAAHERSEAHTHPDLFWWRPRHSRRRSLLPVEWKIIPARVLPSPEPIYCHKPQDAVDYWHRHVATAPHFNPECECLVVLLLNVRSRIRGHHFVSMGAHDQTMAHPREVFRAAVIGSAWCVVLMHNHPSGEPEPSSGDVAVTGECVKAGKILKVQVADHIIVGHQRHCSLREAGYLQP